LAQDDGKSKSKSKSKGKYKCGGLSTARRTVKLSAASVEMTILFGEGPFTKRCRTQRFGRDDGLFEEAIIGECCLSARGSWEIYADWVIRNLESARR
jgi:hypothetical protein